jgi:TetR/AcrR family transcriptional regulator, transcriptional repressor of bet genes
LKEDNKVEGKQSFIGEARREQIVEAAIITLDEIGFINASLSQIAKRAGISTALISYHFSDKNDLMNHLLVKLLEGSTSYIMDRVNRENTAQEKLNAFIESSLAYQGTHPTRYMSLIEIIFNARTPDNIPYYKLGDDEDQIMYELQQIIREGQEKGEFGAFNVEVMASMIQGAIGEYMAHAAITKKVDLETYSHELVNIVNRALKN